MKDILFICKNRNSSGGNNSAEGKYGLYNSASFVVHELSKFCSCVLEVAQDGNDINRLIVKHMPKRVILEAFWVTPEKLQELSKLHPSIKWIVRCHSKLPFLSNEGIAFEWMNKYVKIKNVSLSGNNYDFITHLQGLGYRNILYLPNIYCMDQIKINKLSKARGVIDIGCFGSIRPMKNQLIQACAAINFANKNNLYLKFHINSTRAEQNGDNVLKNIRALFKDRNHMLVEHPWKTHQDFLRLVSQMDIGMQVSYSESFNIVAADFAVCKIPIVTSDEIEFVTSWLYADPNDMNDISKKLNRAFNYPTTLSSLTYFKLKTYNNEAINDWKRILNA